jgi:hypothetical protein
MFGRAFNDFQKKYTYPRTYALMVIYSIIIISQIVSLAFGNQNVFSYVVIVLCIGLLFNAWFNPKKIRRNLLDSVKGIETDVYFFKLSEACISITSYAKEELSFQSEDDIQTAVPSSERESTLLYLKNSYFSVVEKDDYFMLYQSKAMFYIVPKFAFSQQELLTVTDVFRNNLGDRFRKA